MKKSLFVFGASARGILQSAVKAGYQVSAADLFADRDSEKLARTFLVKRNPDDFVDALHQSECHYSMYTGGPENHPRIVKRIEQKSRLLGNGSAVLTRLMDRKSLFRLIRKTGFNTPDSIFQGQQRPVNRPATEWLVKPFRSAGGQGIRRLDVLEETEKSGDLPSTDSGPENETYLQKYLEGPIVTANCLAWRGENGKPTCRTLGICLQLNGDSRFNAPGFTYCGSVHPFPLPAKQQDEIGAIGRLLARHYGLLGLFNLDFVLADGQLHFLEINPRYSASMELLERISGDNLFELQLAACCSPGSGLDHQLDQACRNRLPGKILGKAIWYANRNLVVDPAFCDFAERQVDEEGLPILSDIPLPHSRIEAGSPVFTVFATTRDPDQMAEKLRRTATIFDSRIESADSHPNV